MGNVRGSRSVMTENSAEGRIASPGDIVIVGKSRYVESGQHDWRESPRARKALVVSTVATGEERGTPELVYMNHRIRRVNGRVPRISRGEKLWVARLDDENPGIDIDAVVERVRAHPGSGIAEGHFQRILQDANFQSVTRVPLARLTCPWCPNSNPFPCPRHS